MWSPKRKRNGDRNEFYDNMTKVAIGDAVFSYASSHVKAIGIVTATAVTSDRPREFDDQWDINGWYVRMNWFVFKYPFRPKNYMDVLSHLLPAKYSPMQLNGDGNQGVYLARLGQALGNALLEISFELNSEVAVELEAIS